MRSRLLLWVCLVAFTHPSLGQLADNVVPFSFDRPSGWHDDRYIGYAFYGRWKDKVYLGSVTPNRTLAGAIESELKYYESAHATRVADVQWDGLTVAEIDAVGSIVRFAVLKDGRVVPITCSQGDWKEPPTQERWRATGRQRCEELFSRIHFDKVNFQWGSAATAAPSPGSSPALPVASSTAPTSTSPVASGPAPALAPTAPANSSSLDQRSRSMYHVGFEADRLSEVSSSGQGDYSNKSLETLAAVAERLAANLRYVGAPTDLITKTSAFAKLLDAYSKRSNIAAQMDRNTDASRAGDAFEKAYFPYKVSLAGKDAFYENLGGWASSFSARLAQHRRKQSSNSAPASNSAPNWMQQSITEIDKSLLLSGISSSENLRQRCQANDCPPQVLANLTAIARYGAGITQSPDPFTMPSGQLPAQAELDNIEAQITELRHQF